VKKNSKVSEAYNELGRIGRGPMTPEVIATIRKTIGGKSSLLVSRAVDIAAEHDLRDLVPEIIEAFGRFVEDGADVDKGCRAKTSIVKALNKFEFLGGTIFLAGAYYVQMEPAFGEPEDTAVELRSNCALALARIVHPEAHFVLADLLVDKERPVRVAAVKALAYLSEPESEALMRLKVLTGDRESEVMGECFLGLMTVSPKRSLDFVARYLDDMNAAVAENAALAIGSSHLPEALAKLLSMWRSRPYPSVRRTLTLPIALIRSEEAFDHLVGAIRDADPQTAADAVSALHLFSGDAHVDRVRAAVDARGDREVSGRFREVFEGEG
jgi:HEAT repeat protein